MLATAARLLFLLGALTGCAGSTDTPADKGQDTQGQDSDSGGSALVGCQDWSNWDCTVSAGGCGATCEDYSILCNGGSTCNFAGGSSCTDLSGSGCDLCEAAVASCGAGWGL